ncbi:MAG TPA: type II toxin-antitoxin system RelE/ParE family toxin [Chitinophagales bacterium]|nr:type II toxin-antitoxin system RelE/ParE family toxin [Chitinophagales bacterium]
MKVFFSEFVEDDLAQAYEWYELKSAGLGEEFLLAFNKALALITEHPKIFAVKYLGFRICLLNRFPFGIHFKEDDGSIYIIGVYHTSRSPAEWIGRL